MLLPRTRNRTEESQHVFFFCLSPQGRKCLFFLKSVEKKWAELISATRFKFGGVDSRSDHRPSVVNGRNFSFGPILTVTRCDVRVGISSSRSKTGLKARQRDCRAMWQPLTSTMSINWLH